MIDYCGVMESVSSRRLVLVNIHRNDFSNCYFGLDSGALMNDATILPCGHSFGVGGLIQVKKNGI